MDLRLDSGAVDGLSKVLDKLAAMPDDTIADLVIFYAGHGTRSGTWVSSRVSALK